MGWQIWVQNFRDYIRANKDNEYDKHIEYSDKIIAFKEGAGANRQDRIYTIEEIAKSVSGIIINNHAPTHEAGGTDEVDIDGGTF